MTDNILEVKGLTKVYDGAVAVHAISFYVTRGEIFGFLGPNGAGKTTTINMLIGMAKITSGEIFYNGINRSHTIKKAQEFIGVVEDESNLYDELSGFDNLCFCGALYGLPKATRRARATELLDLFHLSDVAEKKYRTYSRGMKRRLTIAAALIHSPEILFLDEPTTSIDVASMRQIRNLIRELNQGGTTIFLTTHYIEEAERLCHRVAFIHKGNIIQTGRVGKLITDAHSLHSMEIRFEARKGISKSIVQELGNRFPENDFMALEEGLIKMISPGAIDIIPVLGFLASEGLPVYEARQLRPSLEEIFVKSTGIEIDQMKREKEKK